MSYLPKSNFRNAAVGLSALAVVAFAALTAFSPRYASASDHVDSPAVAQDVAADIGDLWAFLDPNDNSRVVLAMDTKGFIVSSEHFGQAIFDSNLRYRFEIENTGDATPDLFVDVRYSPGLGRLTTQTATITLPNGTSFTAPTTVATQDYTPPPPVVTTDKATGVQFFGGVAADAFFLDDTGANRLVASSLATPGAPDFTLLGNRGGRNTYAGFNQLMTMVSIPVAMLRGRGNVIGINAVTQRQEIQLVHADSSVEAFGPWMNIDRSGNPLVNNGLIPAPRKNEYNGASTQDDANGRFVSSLTQSLANFGTNAVFSNMILTAVQKNGDILRLDITVPNSGPGGGTNADGGFGLKGGRRLMDDVVDATFTLLHNGIPTTDNVNAPSKTLKNQFPFVSDPYQPFPPGTVSDGTQQ
jgi:hypothetical protein